MSPLAPGSHGVGPGRACPLSLQDWRQGGFARILIRFCHILRCSEAVKPPMTAFSLLIRVVANAWTPLEHMIRLAYLYDSVTFGDGRILTGVIVKHGLDVDGTAVFDVCPRDRFHNRKCRSFHWSWRRRSVATCRFQSWLQASIFQPVSLVSA